MTGVIADDMYSFLKGGSKGLGDSLSPLLFVVILIPLTHILRKAKPGYQFTNSGGKINHLLFMDDVKLDSKSEKTLDSLIQTVCISSIMT